MTNLSININKIAWLRNARDGDIPNLVDMTMNIIDSGCHGITVHPRPDLRHITPKDVAEIKKIIPSNIEFNIIFNFCGYFAKAMIFKLLLITFFT